MANLTGFRNLGRLGDGPLANYEPSFGLAAGEVIYGGSLVFVDTSTGYAYASTGATRVCAGYNDGADLDNSTGANGAISVVPRRAAVLLTNSGTSALANSDRGILCYAEDNQTARKANTGNAYAPLGAFIGLSGTSAVVEVGAGFLASQSSQTSLAAVPFLTSTASSLLSAEVNLGALTTGVLFITVAAGTATPSIKVIGTDIQAWDADLDAIAALASNGLITRTGAGTAAARTITAGSASITVSNGNGVSGNPTIGASASLDGLSQLAGTGFITQTGGTADNGTFAERSLTSSDSSLVINNPAGVAGNPDIQNPFACVEIADPGTAAAIPVVKSSTIMFTVGAGAETNTLAIPTFVGQTIRLTVGSLAGGTRAVTAASAINAAGNTVMTFNAARDNCELRAVKVGGVLAWEIGFNASVALS